MRRLSPATILAAIALFVALTGTAAAGAVALITGKQIKNGSIEAVDLSANAKRALKGKRGPAGPPGRPGAVGLAGPAGPQGPPGVQSLTPATASVSVDPSASGVAEAVCPSGQRAVSGGFSFGGVTRIYRRNDAGTGWIVGGLNNQGSTTTLTAIAYCLSGLTS